MIGSSVEERAALIEMAGEFARGELLPRAAELDAQDASAIARAWRSISELGFDRAVLPDDLGGAGIGLNDLLAVVEELATGDGGVAALVLMSNVALCALPRPVIERIEPGQRWTAAVPRASLMVKPPRDFVHGSTLPSLPFVLGAAGADGVAVLLAKYGGKPPCALPAKFDQAAPVTGQLGLRAAQAANVETGDLEDGAVLEPAMLHPLYAATLMRFGIGAIARGIQRAALATAVDYATARRQGGLTIVHHGAVRELLSNIAAPLDGSCAPHWPAEGAGAKLGSSLIRAGLAAKIQHTDAAVVATTDAVQVFGGTGYMVETGAEKLMRDAKYCQLLPEANWRARELLMQEVGHPRDL